MYESMIQATAQIWLRAAEFSLVPLRVLAACSRESEAEFRQLQEEVWDELLAQPQGGLIRAPIFTDSVVARAKSI